MSAPDLADVPPVVVTVTSTLAAPWAGDVAVILVELCTTTFVAA
jgi:hypothetical protein